MDIFETFLAGDGSGSVPVQLAEVLSKSALPLDAQILLVAEEDDASCSN